ncbi:3-phosphoshikimate 1-carboxyvinyltransferase [Adhaeribacter rhizoryzae]|uniref:3-phosphoshikimate 1-carboxyvinyltransferase n=1 Tax=Adhaeribacter rhizoryzae TaxID=2607907 RepID=A0A5M6DK58_9BACT|nr:3-phosphoshikimate 1-carboxyvinyltransferase [Adhaeribacter rhizoryzae]KAA5546662.1 3-phosphoshikimate 1-carboxyvinyltransferase [Adhaeribacter rhizoryzae]
MSATGSSLLYIYHPTQILAGTVTLPASKSESNRALIIEALSGAGSKLDNLSEANDTRVITRLLQETATELNAEDAGTVMRFMTAYLAVTGQQKTITGTPRMLQRPIGVLVDALRELGAQIDYLGQEGYPPLAFRGIDRNHNYPATLQVRGDISSQYISALLMVAPLFPNGLTLELTGKVGSRPYIQMTLALMKHFGVEGHFEGNIVHVPPQMYQPAHYIIESDWSGASYWYSMVALAKEATVELKGLRRNSFQGDSAIATIMQNIGVETTYNEGSVTLTKTARTRVFSYDFSDCPDLAQTIAVVCAAKGIAAEMSGLESLRIKETDRIAALQQELRQIGGDLEDIGNGVFRVKPAVAFTSVPEFQTYEDHRMAMAFAPLALLSKVAIHEPHVVRKSYPRFWQDLESMGFALEASN